MVTRGGSLITRKLIRGVSRILLIQERFQGWRCSPGVNFQSSRSQHLYRTPRSSSRKRRKMQTMMSLMGMLEVKDLPQICLVMALLKDMLMVFQMGELVMCMPRPSDGRRLAGSLCLGSGAQNTMSNSRGQSGQHPSLRYLQTWWMTGIEMGQGVNAEPVRCLKDAICHWLVASWSKWL